MAQALIEARLPADNSLTNQLILEGLLYIMEKNRFERVGPREMTVNPDVLRQTYAALEDSEIDRVQLAMVGKNDTGPIQRFLKRLGIKLEEKVTTYRRLLGVLKQHNDKLPAIARMSLKLAVHKAFVSIGDLKNKEEGITLQIFKAERYTGITCGELPFTSEQLGTYLSKEALLSGLLGVYSSYVTRVVEDRNTYHFFLFFEGSELANLLEGNYDLQTLFLLKNAARNEIAEILRNVYKEELLLCEVILSSKLQNLLRQYNLKSISLLLARVAQEGQTYKIYHLLPLTIYQHSEDEVHRVLERIFNPGNIVVRRLRSNTNPEYSNLISAVNGAYRFLVLNDYYGLYQLARELLNAADKLETSQSKNDRATAPQYRLLVSELKRVKWFVRQVLH